jgi:two-component system, NtrC family, sensor kinase
MSDIVPIENFRVLVIDDNRAIHEDFKKILNQPPPSRLVTEFEAELFGNQSPKVELPEFQIDSAFQGREGLAFIERSLAENQPYAMAFVDVRMPPGWDGIETACQIGQRDPDIQIVICTAYSDYSWEEMTAKLGLSDRLLILKKPFDNVEVIQMAYTLTEKWRLRKLLQAKMDQLEAAVAARTLELQASNEKLKTEIAERARTEESLRQAQKMEALGQLAGGVAHDFNNLLTVIHGYAQCLQVEPHHTPEGIKALQEISSAAERASKLTAQMLTFSRKKPLQRQDLNLNELIGRMTTMLGRLLGENIAIESISGNTPLIVNADASMMEQIILNLAVNARDAMPKGGHLSIHSSVREVSEGDCRQNAKAKKGRFAVVTVSDNGCGIPPEILPRIFEPFFTTKAPDKGTGFGLATVYGIVEQHGGWIEVESQTAKGTHFKVFLPAKAVNPNQKNDSNKKIKAAGGTETILLVEDQDLVRQLAKTVLQDYGYRVYEAGSGTEALSIWTSCTAEIDLLLTDMVLPGRMSGYELAKKFQTQKRDLKVAYTTGYGTEALDPACVLKEGLNFLPKPYSPDNLAHMVRHCLNEPSKT